MSASSMRDWALWYARNAISVFPCKPRGKEPLTPHGFKDAATDAAQIGEWWEKWPQANIGVPTGLASGFLVVDVDPRNGGEDSLDDLRAKYGPFPDTAEQMTGGGGRHIIFRHPGIQVPKELAPGIDLKGDGGYIVVAPSIHPSGNPYRWDGISGAKALLSAAEPPAWLLERISACRNGLRMESAEDAAKWGTGERNNKLASVAGTMRRRGCSQEAIAAALLEENRRRCDPLLPETEVRRIAESVAQYEPARPTGFADVEEADAVSPPWPDPIPLEGALPPVRAFSLDLLPAAFRALVADTAERMQVPMDLVAAVLVLCLAGVVNRRAVIQPKANDTGWVEVPNLWGAIIAPPGYLKSPVIQAVTKSLREIEAEWRHTHEGAMAEYAQAKEEYELRHAHWQSDYKASLKNNKTTPARPVDESEEPVLRRLVLTDATFQKLHEIMADNPAGVFVVRDELTGWLAQLDTPGREGERSFCLSAWKGDTPHTVDRIERGRNIHVPHCCMSMLGGIQPARLRSYMADTLKSGPNDDGLLQRFQVMVWPDTTSDWTYIDRPPDAAAEQQVTQVFLKLVELGVEHPARFCFAPDAQELFIEWLGDLESKVRGDGLHPALNSHLSKYRSLMPSLALLFELADRASFVGFDGSTLGTPGNFVSLEHTQQAAEFCSYLEAHMWRIYSCVVSPQIKAAQDLAAKLKQRNVFVDGSFCCRDVYLKGWSGLDSPATAKQAIEVLVDAGWIRPLPDKREPTGGRPADRYQINPKVRQ